MYREPYTCINNYIGGLLYLINNKHEQFSAQHLMIQYDIIERVFNPFSAGSDFRRQNLTSIDVRLWRLKSIPILKYLKNCNGHP